MKQENIDEKILLILNKLYGYELKIKEELEKQGYIVEFFNLTKE